MAVRNYALGTLNAIVYFENNQGRIALPPSTAQALQIKDRMNRAGWELREASTLGEVDALQKRLEEQTYRERQREIEMDQRMGGHVRASIRSRLYQRMISSSTGDYEKEFIKNYLQLRDDKRTDYQKRFSADQMYFEAREFNQSSHHLQELADRVEDSKQTECVKCHSYRRVQGSTMCMRCRESAGQEIAERMRANSNA